MLSRKSYSSKPDAVRVLYYDSRRHLARALKFADESQESFRTISKMASLTDDTENSVTLGHKNEAREAEITGGTRQKGMSSKNELSDISESLSSNLEGARKDSITALPVYDVELPVQSVAQMGPKSGKLIFTSEFHEIIYTFTESKFFTFFILSIILLNTIMLVAQTWQVVLVRAGK